MTDYSINAKKWVVGIHQDRTPQGQTIGKIFKMNDPCTGDMRDYAIMSSVDGSGSYIAEFQSVPGDFSSFIVGRHVVKDGDLYLINQIDPLFFYIGTQSIHDQREGDGENNRSESKQESWKPYDQFLEKSELPHEIVRLISEEQIQHVCSIFQSDELYFKFNADKTIQWLRKKQELVLKSLIRQDQRKRKMNDKTFMAQRNNARGSISANFNSYEPSSVSNHRQEISQIASKSDTRALKIESIQVVCNYLNETWSKKLIEHFGYTVEQIKSCRKTDRKSFSFHIDSDARSKDAGKKDNTEYLRTKKAAANQMAISAARTIGNKRLAKLSTKGMKSIGSFFTQGKGKKPKR